MSDSFISQPRVNISLPSIKRKPKIHDYSRYVRGEDYVFDPLDEGNGGYMTGQGRNIKRSDRLILSDGKDLICYQVDTIDYYSNPPDMWVALLKEM
jgi:hypothetical protein